MRPEAAHEGTASSRPSSQGEAADSSQKTSGILDGGADKKGEELSEKRTAPQSGSGAFRERFFDRDVIGKLAQGNKPKGDKGAPKPGNSITFDAKDYKYYGYMERLKEKIESIWRYPNEAAARGIHGDLYIQFTIKRDGHLGAVELVRTSGNASLDDAALRAVRNADPFWPLPENVEEDALTITGHFVYTLHGYYLR